MLEDVGRDYLGPLHFVYVILPRCPACNGDRLKVYGHAPSPPKAPECKTQYTRCRDCGHKFKTVWEDPDGH
jgi:hypothetical protein